MREPAPLNALRGLLDASLEIPPGFLARARKHVDDMERLLAGDEDTAVSTAGIQRTLDGLEGALLDHQDRLHDLTRRPGYRLLDSLAQRRRRPAPSPANSVPADDDTQEHEPPTPPIALAVAEWHQLLAALAYQCPDDEQLTGQLARARSELSEVTPRLAAAEAAQQQLDTLAARLSAAETRVNAVQRELTAVRQRASSRLLDALHLPATARRSAPKQPALPEESPSTGWPATPPDWNAPDGPALALLDLPEPSAVVLRAEPLLLGGWAFAANAPVSKLDVFVNGVRAGAARLGYVRADVRDQYQVPHALLSGFDFRCDPATFGGAEHVRIELFAQRMSGGRSLVASRDVWVAATVERAAAPALVIAKRPAPPDFHLLVVTHDLGYGGGQLWLSELLERMGAGRDFACTLVCPQTGPLAPVLRRLGITIHVNGWTPADRADVYEGRVAELASWAAAQNFSSVLVNTFLSFPGADMATRLGLPCAWAIHESWTPSMFWSAAYPPDGVDPGVKNAALRALGACDAVVFEADATRALYAGHTRPGAAMVVKYGIRTQVIRDYCDEIDRETARKQLGLHEFRRVLLVMGTVEPRKWQTMIALAFQQVAAGHPDTALVFVGGGDTPYAHGLTEYLRRVGLNQQVRVEPVVADTYPWYRAADALICASDVESLPRSVLEAMAFGVPVAAASVFGLPELISDGETGLLFEGADLRSAVDAFDRLLTMRPDALDAIARAGQQLVFDDYDSAGYAQRLTDVLHEISGRVPASAL
ncbi:MAG TPA: glycosyltransferase family 4 protein [Frankiaceae bacterium]|nr:glycosyltransferase family 4 protein [Frankiaceae bacterium]